MNSHRKASKNCIYRISIGKYAEVHKFTNLFVSLITLRCRQGKQYHSCNKSKEVSNCADIGYELMTWTI